MSTPVIALVIGVLLIWVVANGRAAAVWQAATGVAPSTNTPGIQPGAPSGGSGFPLPHGPAPIPPGSA